jgi:hypothetical protein
VRKLSARDTWTGMAAEQLRCYINQLGASGCEQSSTRNFGVGAKLAAGSRDPYGLECRSVHHGRGRLSAVIDAQVREWCEQILVEVVLAARNSSWTPEQLDALLSPSSFTAALLPRHLLHATLLKRLGQKLGTSRSGPAGLPLGPPERTDHAR